MHPDTTLTCRACGRAETVNYAACLGGRQPWPRCHAATMAFRDPVPTATIDAAVAAACAPARAVLTDLRAALVPPRPAPRR